MLIKNIVNIIFYLILISNYWASVAQYDELSRRRPHQGSFFARDSAAGILLLQRAAAGAFVGSSSMASAGAVASGVRQQLCRPPSRPFLCASPLLHRRREGLRSLTLLSALSFPPSTSYCPPLTPAQSRFSRSSLGSRRLFSAPVAASSPATRDTVSLSLDEENDEEEGESKWGEDEYDIASFDGDEDGEEEEEEEEDDEIDDERGEGAEVQLKIEGRSDVESPALQGQEFPRYPSPVLSVKEKKELASYAHSLGKKLKSQQVGKSGVTPSVVAAFLETLEANELLKVPHLPLFLILLY